MNEFVYPWYYKLFYRYGNIPLTLMLSFYLIVLVEKLDTHLVYFLPLVITLGLIYLLNRHFLVLYKILPYTIEADEEKIIAKNFFLSSRRETIKYTDISSLEGGLFDGRTRGVMRVWDGKSKVCIGFYSSLKDYNKLGTLILSKVDKNVYDTVLQKVAEQKKKKTLQ